MLCYCAYVEKICYVPIKYNRRIPSYICYTTAAELCLLGLLLLLAESEIFRSEKAIGDGYYGCEKLRWRRPNVEILNKELHADIIDNYRAYNANCVAFKLLTSRLFCSLECYIAVEKKACEECYREDDY